VKFLPANFLARPDILINLRLCSPNSVSSDFSGMTAIASPSNSMPCPEKVKIFTV
jgi:hypothetical protein